jgi:hypothetical protein
MGKPSASEQEDSGMIVSSRASDQAATNFKDNFAQNNTNYGDGSAKIQAAPPHPYSSPAMQNMALVPGHATQNMPGKTPAMNKTPYDHGMVGKSTFDTIPQRTQQNWHAVDVADGYNGEKATARDLPSNARVLVQSVLVLIAIMTVYFAWSSLSSAKKKTQRGMGLAAIVCFAGFVAIVGSIISGAIKFKPEKQTASSSVVAVAKTRDMADTFPDKVLPDTPYAQSDMLRAQGSNIDKMEGPRPRFGYQRSKDPQPSLQVGDMMRDPATMNVRSQEEMDTYMAQMRGENINQFHKAHPYMPFAANWENRGQMDDAETIHGIGGAPDNYMRKAMIRNPRVQQGGAQTSHLQDPAAYYNPPVDKVHPWMAQGRTHNEPSVMMNSQFMTPEALVAQQSGYPQVQQGYGQDVERGAAMYAQERKQLDDLLQAQRPNGPPAANSAWLQPMETSTKRQNYGESQQNQSMMGYAGQYDPSNGFSQQQQQPMSAWLQPVETSSKTGFASVPGSADWAKNYALGQNNMMMQPPVMPQMPLPPPGMMAPQMSMMPQMPVMPQMPMMPMAMNQQQMRPASASANAEALFSSAFGEKQQPTDQEIRQAQNDTRR